MIWKLSAAIFDSSPRNATSHTDWMLISTRTVVWPRDDSMGSAFFLIREKMFEAFSLRSFLIDDDVSFKFA